MHIVTRKRLNDFAKIHPDCEAGLVQWFQEMRRASFSNIQEVRAIFPHADKVGKFTVFNIGGNNYRLLVLAVFAEGIVAIDRVGTHAQYDKWKL